MLDPSALPDQTEFARGEPALNVLGGEEPGIIGAQDFRFRIAEQAFGAGIPAGNAPGGVHRNERVILRPVNDQPVPFIGLVKLSVQNGSVALTEKGLAQGRQKIGIKAQRGAAYGNLMQSRMPQFLRRESKIPGGAPQGEGLGILVEGLTGEQDA